VTFLRTHKIAIGCIALAAFAAAQTPPAAPKFKDDKEQTEAIAANTEKDPKAKLEKLAKEDRRSLSAWHHCESRRRADFVGRGT